jgi:predicted alpha/beta-hydrolase family hydrolase
MLVPARRRRSQAIRVTTRPRSLAVTSMLVGLAGLAVTGFVAASVFVAEVNTYAAGLLMGAGFVAVWWAFSWYRHRLATRRKPPAGRSRTLDCRLRRWHRTVAPGGQPHPPALADRRVRACRSSRRP